MRQDIVFHVAFLQVCQTRVILKNHYFSPFWIVEQGSKSFKQVSANLAETSLTYALFWQRSLSVKIFPYVCACYCRTLSPVPLFKSKMLDLFCSLTEHFEALLWSKAFCSRGSCPLQKPLHIVSLATFFRFLSQNKAC